MDHIFLKDCHTTLRVVLPPGDGAGRRAEVWRVDASDQL